MEGADDSWLDEFLESAAPPLRDDPAALQRIRGRLFRGQVGDPVQVGRYTLVRVLGEGGMGTVYEATDTKLARRVALKRVRTTYGRRSAQSTARLIREARALAQVEHPNVVSIFDVGHDEDEGHEAFIAMELVDGLRLDEWLAEGPAHARIVEVFVQAGRGLVAAHDAGIVHRDFKPSNVLVHRDGPAIVLDFGLAADRDETRASQPTQVRDEASSLDERLTSPGVVLGTPAYMAPEQRQGEAADARSDQFSFCMSLYEALVGERPYSSDQLDAAGRGDALAPPVPPSDERLDDTVVAVLRRGLSLDPAHRFASMRDVVGRLEKGGRRRRWIPVGLGLVLSVGAVVLMPDARAPEQAASGPAGLCGGVAPRPVLDERTAADATRRLHAALGERGRAAAEDATHRLAAFDRRWLETWAAVCSAAAAADDAQVHCLRETKARAHGVAAALSRADAKVMEHIGHAVRQLPDPSTCADHPRRAWQRPHPADAAAATEVTEIRLEIAAIEGRGSAGDFQGAAEVARAVLERAKATGFAPLIAEATIDVGTYDLQLGDPGGGRAKLEEAYFTAMAEDAPSVALDAAGLLAFVHGVVELDLAAARRWHQHAIAAARSMPVASPNLGTAELNFASALIAAGRFAEALAHLELARASFRGSARRDEEECQVLQAISAARLGLGEYAAALEAAQGAVAIAEGELAGTPKLLADALVNLANALTRLGRMDDAIEAQRRALQLRRQVLGDSHQAVGEGLANLAAMVLDVERVREAVEMSQEAVEILERTAGPDHLTTATARGNLGLALVDAGDPARGLQILQAAATTMREVVGESYPSLLLLRDGMARAQHALGDYEAARAIFESLSHSCDAGALPPDHCATIARHRAAVPPAP